MSRRAVVGEFVGTGLLLFVVVGSGLTVGDVGTGTADLFFHAVAVGAALAVLIVLFAATSGSHFNPAVTLAMWRAGRISTSTGFGYAIAQVAGAIVGVAVAHLSFGEPVFTVSGTVRPGWGPLAAELVGTLVLVLLVLGLVEQDNGGLVGPAVGTWVTVMVFSTSSTGFLNPAVTVARAVSDSYTGIAPVSVPGFVIAQVVGGLIAVAASASLAKRPELKGT
jgi:arsenate reductase